MKEREKIPCDQEFGYYIFSTRITATNLIITMYIINLSKIHVNIILHKFSVLISTLKESYVKAMNFSHFLKSLILFFIHFSNVKYYEDNYLYKLYFSCHFNVIVSSTLNTHFKNANFEHHKFFMLCT